MWTPIAEIWWSKYGAFSVCCGVMVVHRLPKLIQYTLSLYPDPWYINNNWFVLRIVYVSLRIWWKLQHSYETSLFYFLARTKQVLNTQLNLTNELVRYDTTNRKHTLLVIESVLGLLRRARYFSPLFKSHSGVCPWSPFSGKDKPCMCCTHN